MDAREHRARAEQLLADARHMQADMSGRFTASDITNALLAAQTHAALYLGDQFATEFDPRETADALLKDVRRVHDGARPDGSVTPLYPLDTP